MARYKDFIANPDFTDEMLDRTKWPTVHVDKLGTNKREIFINRKEAIDLYLDGDMTIKDICIQCKVNTTDLYRLLRRCFETDNTGRIFGYRALIPNFRIKPYTKTMMICISQVKSEPFRNLILSHQIFGILPYPFFSFSHPK